MGPAEQIRRLRACAQFICGTLARLAAVVLRDDKTRPIVGRFSLSGSVGHDVARLARRRVCNRQHDLEITVV
jgi:hypothetical protein